jgi:titin
MTAVSIVLVPMTPATAAKPVVKLKAEQAGSGAKLNWTVKKGTVIKAQKLRIDCALPELTTCANAALVGTTITLKPSARSRTVSGLTAGVLYTFTLSSPQFRTAETNVSIVSQLGAPRNLSAAWSMDDTAKVTINWSAAVLYQGAHKVRLTIADDTKRTRTVSVGAGLDSLTLTDLDPSKSYRIEVFGSNAAGTGRVATANLTAALPAQTKDLSVSVTSEDSVRLSWTATVTPGATTYVKIDSKTAGASRVGDEITVPDAASIIDVTGLSKSATYSFTVATRNVYGWGAASSVSALMAVAPSAPRSLIATATGGSVIDLSWTVPSTDGGAAVTDYIVEYATGSSAWNVFNDGVATVTTARVSGLTNGSTYRFRVSARNAVNTGVASNIAEATSWSVPGAPSGLTATVLSTTSIRLNWNAPASNGGDAVRDYRIEYSTDNASTWNTYTDEVSTTTTVTLTSLTPVTSYQFRVSAQNGVNAGAVSNIVTATTTMAPSTPGSLAVQSTTKDSVTLVWFAPTETGGSAITDYVVEYSVGTSGTWSTFADGTSTNLSTIVTGLNPGVTYLFRVKAVNAVGSSTTTATVTTTTPVDVPTAPRTLVATSGNGLVNLTWTAPAGNGGGAISDYEIDISTNDGLTWTQLSDSVSTTASYSVTGLNAGQTYRFRVRAVNSGGVSTNSNEASAVVLDIPSAVQSLTVSATGIGQLSVSWSAPASNGGSAITDYVVEGSANGGANWLTVNDGVSTTTSAVLSGLSNGTTYQVRVRAKNAIGEGINPTIASATTWNAPTNVVLTTGVKQLGVTWSAPTQSGGNTITDYLVEFSSDAGSTWTVFADGISGSLSATITGLADDTLYAVRVRAVNTAGNSPYSQTASETTAAVPAAPTNVQLTTGVKSLAVSWTAPAANGSAITDYVVEYSSDAGSTWNVFNDAVSDTPSANITGLADDTAYLVRVSAVNAVGTGATSASASGSTAAVPGAPTNLMLSAISFDEVSVTWSAPASNGGDPVNSYEVEVSTNGDPWILAATVNGSTFTTNISGLASGAPHEVRVRAANGVGYSPYVQGSVMTPTP